MLMKKTNQRLFEIDYSTISKTMLQQGDTQRNLYKKANFQSLYYLSDWRCNYLRWLPFAKGNKILDFECELGTSTAFFIEKGLKVVNVYDDNEQMEVIKKRVKHKDVEYVQFVNCFENITEKEFDYIIVGSVLNQVQDAEAFLNKIKRLLNQDGFIVIAGFNKLGLSFLNGKPDFYSGDFLGSIASNSGVKAFDKYEYEKIFDTTGISDYRFYYPYPDHLFTETIFSDNRLPSVGEIKANYRNYNEYNLHIVNDADAFDSVIDNGEFDKFANSFLIIIGDNVDSLFKYIKISNERDKKYQIYTTISNDDEVAKFPCSSDAIDHVKKMNDFYNNINKDKYLLKQIKYCHCKLVHDSVMFDFIQGETLEKKISDCRQNDLFAKVVESIQIVKGIILCQEQTKFIPCAEFNEVFGDYYTLEGECASVNANIDLILDNIIVNDVYNVIDYEWTFNFSIPNDFILFRTIFHSKTINGLNMEDRKKVYLEFGIDNKKFDMFMDMEKAFQWYVSKDENKVINVLDNYNNRNIFFDQLGVDTLLKELVVKDDNSVIVSYNYVDNYVNKVIDLDEVSHQEIQIMPNKGNCIIHISGIWGFIGKKRESLSFSSNAVLRKGDTYFFNETAVITVVCEALSQLQIEYTVYYTNSDVATNIIDLNLKNTELTNELAQLNANLFVRILRKLKLIK